MPDTYDRTQNNFISTTTTRPFDLMRECFMDFDFDLDNSWPLDHLTLMSNSIPSEQPFSPLWTFSDPADDVRPPSSAAGHRGHDHPRFLSYAVDSGHENNTEDDDRRRMSSPFIGLLPLENPDSYFVIKERMTRALRYFKEWTEQQHVLAQVWAPVKNENRYVLSTTGQPFVLGPNGNGLHQYRLVSVMYKFDADGENDKELGLPGRVFRQKLPEWTPDVQYYSDREYSRLNHALQHNVRGTLALPVFEPSGQACVGVVELIMTSQKINYAPEVDKVCKALEAVNLKSSDILEHPTSTQICNEGRHKALAEILEMLTVVCETHKLPLAQTWVPCRHRSVLAHGGGLKKSCTSIDGSCMGQVCMSTTDVSFYIVDAHMWGFREACVEHHLQKGQGVAGRAFLSQSSSFCRDITQFRKTDYPLVHYARMFGINSCFAICLRSSYTGDDDYILEFFLPPNVKGKVEIDQLLGSILATMKQHFKSISDASRIDLNGEIYVEVFQPSSTEMINSIMYELIQIPSFVRTPSQLENSLRSRDIVAQDMSQKQSEVKIDIPSNRSRAINTVDDKGNNNHMNERSNPSATAEYKNTRRTSERKRGKAEKVISLEVLQQYFSGSLKDAAKSLGVCPTTMKRICRQHGIARWPSRKINKVSRSLSKLKRVIESVQGAGGTFDLTSIASSQLAVPETSSCTPCMNGVSQQDLPGTKPFDLKVEYNGSVISETMGKNKQVMMEDNCPHAGVVNREVPQDNQLPEFSKVSNSSRSGNSTKEESAGTPTSHNACQDNPASENMFARNPTAYFVHEQFVKVGGSPELPIPPISTCMMPNALSKTEHQKPVGPVLIEESGSSKDLKNLCISAVAPLPVGGAPNSSRTNPSINDLTPKQTIATSINTVPQPRQGMNSLIIKATYRNDIIRFKIPVGSSIVELREAISKRFKIDVGTFDIKYLDDDHEWVLIACDADLQECLDLASSSGSHALRLLVHDILSNLGSSCESNGD